MAGQPRCTRRRGGPGDWVAGTGAGVEAAGLSQQERDDVLAVPENSPAAPEMALEKQAGLARGLTPDHLAAGSGERRKGTRLARTAKTCSSCLTW